MFNQSPTPSYFAGGFNQPIMCGGEPRAMLRKVRGKADPPFYTIQICVPKHGMAGIIFTILLLYGTFNSFTHIFFAAVNLIFSFTNGVNWDGPYRLQFQVPNGWRNKPIEFFNEVLPHKRSVDPLKISSSFVITRCQSQTSQP